MLDNIEHGHTQEIQTSCAFIISNISMQQRNHTELNQLNSVPRLFAMIEKLPSLKIDSLQLLLNLSFHPQSNFFFFDTIEYSDIFFTILDISQETLIQWDGVNRVISLLDDCTEQELILAIKVLINLSYISIL